MDKAAAVPPSLAEAGWLKREETQTVLAAIECEAPARIVGGSVRNALIGVPVKDIDIATPARPETVMKLAEAVGLKVVPTGLEHGTVTVIVNHTPFEVTTLRRDVETDGRRAIVAFTDDWREDANRRDFTINALYCDAGGTVHDPLGGYADLVERKVRFIGDAHDRIREDYLRILRFFRFTAEYTSGDVDKKGLQAAIELQHGLDSLSAERVRAEMMRLIVAPKAAACLAVMARSGVLARVLGVQGDVAAFKRLLGIETALSSRPDPVVRLGVLAVAKLGGAMQLRDKLRLSSNEFERLARTVMPDPAYDPTTPERVAKATLYRHGAQAFIDGLLYAWSRSGDPSDSIGRRERLRLVDRWTAPEMPVRGSDVLELGIASGPLVGKIISEFEDWWIGAEFPADPARLAEELQRIAMVTKS